MPLHINLYHEIERQELARRRDPLRLSMLVMLLTGIGFVINYFVALERAHEINSRYSALQTQWAKISPRAKEAKAKEDALNSAIAASEAMKKNVNGRFYIAPLLDQIVKAVPRTVQLTHLGAEAPPDEKVENAVLSVSGISSAVEPRKEAEAVRTSINQHLSGPYKGVTSQFRTLDDSDQYVLLDGHRLATAIFDLQFTVRVHEPPPPPPAAGGHKRREASE